MPDVVSDDELNALAAEYVLGTLDYEERKGATALLEVDHTFRGIVRVWERRFGELHLMVEAVDPDPQLWQRIRQKMPQVEQIALAIPSSAELPPSPEHSAVDPELGAGPLPAEPDGALPAVPSPIAADPEAGSAAPAEPSEGPAAAPAADESAKREGGDLTLEELAALIPAIPRDDQAEPPGQSPAEQPPMGPDGQALAADELPSTRAPDQIPRGFVPPPPMIARPAPPVVAAAAAAPRRGGGWMAATVLMTLLVVALAGLLATWRYFPDRLPPRLRAEALLNLNLAPATPAKAKAQPQVVPFEE